ncbi:MAG: serine/threonine-protein kinase, partial [Kofleriaceae bacterium]|nr:serine/threonine-protein kinase [Kofleriaceae bacterium]
MPAVAIAGLPQRLGKYEIVLPLAAGGMARIYIARTTGIGMFERHVVLKLITPERANDAVAVQMFLEEARLAASLNHQNVALVFEVGEDGGIHYLAMEYVHGQDMRALLAKAGSQGTRVPLELALTIVAGAAAGLNHAHERRAPDGTPLGIVHRDVSPSNIMIGYDGSVKLLDFGIAKAAARTVETQSGIIKGKFAYMAPEQCRGRDVDRRSDVFSLGIILYEISTQHRCFRADSDFDTMHRIVTGDVVRPTRIIQGYPQALEAIVMKALAIDPSMRYQSAGALLEAIESFAVSSRMSLSTMSLGRFMRDMFGDTPEPWLTQNGRADDGGEPKETTISNTNKAWHAVQAEAAKGQPRSPVVAAQPAAAASDGLDDDDEAAKTFLMGSGPNADDGIGGPSWSSATDLDPAVASRHTQPTEPPLTKPPIVQGLAPQRPVPNPAGAAPTLVGTGRPPAGQFPATPGSNSQSRVRRAGPVSGAQPIASTRHGYASGNGVTRGDTYSRGDASQDASAEAGAPALVANRRPLFIGLGLAAIGIVA